MTARPPNVSSSNSTRMNAGAAFLQDTAPPTFPRSAQSRLHNGSLFRRQVAGFVDLYKLLYPLRYGPRFDGRLTGVLFDGQGRGSTACLVVSNLTVLHSHSITCSPYCMYLDFFVPPVSRLSQVGKFAACFCFQITSKLAC